MLVGLATDYHCLPLKQKERTPTRTRCFDIFFIFMCKIISKTTNCTVKENVLRKRVKQCNGSDGIGWMDGCVRTCQTLTIGSQGKL